MVGIGQGPRPPSIYDVARRAGVSYQTVSRVINSSAQVSDRSRTLVLQAIADLDFHPSSAARAFSTGRGRDIAVIVSELESYGWAGTLAGIQQRARERGRSIVLHELRATAETIAWLKSQTLHGAIVLTGSPTSRELMRDVALGGHVVGVGDREVDGRSWLSFTEFEGAVDAMRHLAGLGHRSIHHVTVAQLRNTRREDGWRTASPEAARAPVVEIDGSPRAAYVAGAQLAERSDVTAIFCANDQIAIPLIAGVRAAGRTVPAEVSVVGFDDHPLAAYASPPLTTVRQDFRAIGQRAVDLVENGPSDSPQAVRLPATFVVRQSTAPARDLS